MELEKILEEIIEQLKAEGCIIDNAAGNRAEEIIRKHMNGGWISVEERLPSKEECEKNDGAFLVQSCTGEMFVGKIFNEYVSEANDYENHLKCCNTYIAAWRPLPEPYRAELKKIAMTNHEAAEKIMKDICTSKFCNDSCMYGDNICPYDMAKKALEEIQQYREIGTVEECRKAVRSRNL